VANEISIRSQLTVRKGYIDYRSNPVAFEADMAGAKGPTPGAIAASTDGVDVDLSELTTPGVARFMNIDDTNFVEYGIFDPETNVFYPFGKILPGETYVVRLSSNFGEQYAGTGTGTTAATNTLRFKANTASVNVVVEVFEE